MHLIAAAAASTGTRGCLSRVGTHRESTGAVVIRRLWDLDRGRGLDGCWTQGREAQHSWELAQTNERGAGGVEPTMSVVLAQACFGPPGPQNPLYACNLLTRSGLCSSFCYSDSAYLEFFFNNPPASHDPANRPTITQTPLTCLSSSVLK